VTLLAKKLGQRDEQAEPLLRAAQGRHPEDFWLNYALGEALRERKPAESMGFYRAALATRPTVAAVHAEVGRTLYRMGQLDEAIRAYRRAIELDPKAAKHHTNLARCWLAKGQPDGALAECRCAVALDPEEARAHNHLGTGLYDDACAAIRAAADPGSGAARLGEPERAGLRRQAQGWLRADLALRAKLQQDGKSVGWALRAWQTDPALAGVRDRAALEKLPAAECKQWRRLWADVDALLAADRLKDLLEQGQAHAARRGWARAADCYARALQRGPIDDGHFWFEYAAVRLLSGDRPGYAAACAGMVERCGKATDLRAYHVARACTLAPGAVADGAQPGRLAEAELKAHAGEFWSLAEQGALHYRAGRFQEAVPLLEQSLRADPKPGRAVLNWLWLALAEQRLGKAEEARRWLGKAQAWLDQYGDGMPDRADEALGLDLHNWLEAHVLRREAEALLPPR
jgi:tetratricopeptide (TPR) repeat protein